MIRSDAFARAVEAHREAVANCAGTIHGVDRAIWTTPASAGKWSPQQIAEHLAIAYDPPLSELSGGPGFALRLSWWKRRLARWRFLPGILRGRFPEGAPAPREIRPAGGSADPEEAALRLSARAGLFERRLSEACAAGPVRLTHAYFGKLDATQILKLLSAHADHHRKQLSASREEKR